MRLEVEDLSDEQIREMEEELLEADARDILAAWLAGHFSDAEVLEKLKYAKLSAQTYAPSFIIDRMRRGA